MDNLEQLRTNIKEVLAQWEELDTQDKMLDQVLDVIKTFSQCIHVAGEFNFCDCGATQAKDEGVIRL